MNYCFAQDPVNYQFNPNNGLPSNEVYDILADKKGYLWFATDRGVARFNGTSFNYYMVNDGLSDNLVYKLLLSPKGVVWAACNDKTLYYIKGNKFQRYHLNDKLQKLMKLPAYSNILNIKYENDFPKIIATNSKGFIQVINNENLKYDTSIISELKYDNYIKASAFIYSPPLLRKNIAEILPYKFKHINKGFTTLNFKTFAAHRKNGESIISFDKSIYVLKNEKIIYSSQFDVPILNMYLDNNDNLWICFFYNGVKLYKSSEIVNNKNGHSYFKNQIITDVQQDFEGGYWFSSYNQGVFYVPNIKISYLNIPEISLNEDVKEITGDQKDKIYIASNKNRIFVQEQSETKYISQTFNSNTLQISICNDLYFDKLTRHLLAGFSDGLYLLDENGNTLKQFGGIGKCITSNDKYWIAANVSNLKKIDIKNSHLSPKNLTQLESAPYALYVDERNIIWIGVNDGLIKLSGNNQNYFRKDIIYNRINNIKELNKEILILSSLGSGIFIIQNNITKELSLGETKQHNMVNDLAIDGNIVWAATQSGVVKIDLNNISSPKLSYLSIENGFPFNDIRKIYVQNKKVYVIAQSKLITFPSDLSMINYQRPKIDLNSISISNQINISPNENYSFKAENNSIRFDFNAVAYRSGQNIKFNYRLIGLDSTWRKTNQNFVEFNYLNFGNYKFELVAVNEDNFISNEIEYYNFIIPPPIWKSNWFFVLILLILIFSIYSYFKYRIRYEQQRNKEKEEMLLNEQQALLAQVNPHFIFNALNSIQNFILKSDQINAIKYLGRFSRLMRLSLDHANLKWILIDSEIRLLNTYLELEKLRFKDKFEYHISLPDNLNIDNTQIPSMLIQPFVENAIIHGLKDLKDRNGQININFIYQNSILFCEIIDNGIGFEKSSVNAVESIATKKKYGISITKKRLYLINNDVKLPYFFDQQNRVDINGNNFGTVIKVSIPYKTIE